MAPAIVVMPVQNVSAWRDSECVNAQARSTDRHAAEWDLRAALSRDFRTATAANGWGLMGYSTGGFCAVNLALQHTGHLRRRREPVRLLQADHRRKHWQSVSRFDRSPHRK